MNGITTIRTLIGDDATVKEAIRSQAKHLAGIYKRLYMNDRAPQFMCIHSRRNMPQLYEALCTTFGYKTLLTALRYHMYFGTHSASRWPNAVRYEYLRYISRYGKMPPWKLVQQWILKTNQLEFAVVING